MAFFKISCVLYVTIVISCHALCRCPRRNGNFPTPSVPSIPSIPSIPGFPSVPSIPSIPGLPSIPSIPGRLTNIETESVESQPSTGRLFSNPSGIKGSGNEMRDKSIVMGTADQFLSNGTPVQFAMNRMGLRRLAENNPFVKMGESIGMAAASFLPGINVGRMGYQVMNGMKNQRDPSKSSSNSGFPTMPPASFPSMG